MTTFTGTWADIEAPAAVQQKFGLFSVAVPRTPVSHFGMGVQWDSQGCGSAAGETNGRCLVDDPDLLAIHASRRCDVMQYNPFTIYAFADDSLGGQAQLSLHEDNARTRLQNGEQEAAELHLWNMMAAAVTEQASGQNLAYAIGLVEQQLSEQYGAQGVLHMNRLAATVAVGLGVVKEQGGKLVSALGTPVVAGAGYDRVGNTAPTTFAVYGTGPLVLMRSATPEMASAIDRSTNNASVLAQRDYVVGWDCIALGVTATI